MNDPASLAYSIFGISGLILVSLLGAPALQQVLQASSRRSVKEHHLRASHYEDEDGQATEKSIEEASRPILRFSVLSCAMFGTVLCALQSSFAALGFVQLGMWILLMLQSIGLVVQSDAPTSFSLGWKIGCSSLVTFVHHCVDSYQQYMSGDVGGSQITLMIAMSAVTLLLSLFAFSIPRRPDVYRSGILVDQQLTSSFLGWVTFSWARIVLEKTEQRSNLALDDLPEIDHTVRAETLLNAARKTIPRAPGLTSHDLWWWLLLSNSRALLFQLAITVPLSFLSFLPQMCLWDILQRLGASSSVPWAGVAGLGASLLVTAILDTIKYWLSYNQLALRAREQLSLAVFDKAVRLEPNTDESAGRSKAADEDKPQAAHSPINMIAVDAKSVADFLCLSFLLYESPLKLVVASIFLVRLLGWQSLVASMVVAAGFTAANVYTVRRYSSEQDTVMSLRDRSLRMVTEVLRGIRQVKFSALEQRWEARINHVRDQELRAQRAVSLWNILLDLIYLASPIMLSAICLSIYVFVHGTLSAATAFTAISVLRAIDVAMAVVPNVISQLLNASISMRRICRFLEQPNRSSAVVPSEVIEFQDATVAWPGNSGFNGNLTGLNLQFPKDALTVIMGPTGSGKSLLLNAILGGTDIICGTVKAPVSTSFDPLSAPFEPWLIDSSIAYVSQNPWMRRTTVRENILFGLPLNSKRYAQVLYACALQHDLCLLPNADETEIESHGANLSGGQQWRISLARALYSRARVLIMDDIFSAVDVHTREHICRHALAGELMRGRTCALATHHVDLCLSHAKYLVCLEKGTVKLATPVSQDSLAASQLYHPPVATQEVIGPDSASRSRDEEQPGVGALSQDVGKTFVKVGGNAYHWLMLAAAFLGYGVLTLAREWWVSLWTREYERPSTSEPSLLYYLSSYIGLSVIMCLFGVFRAYVALSIALRASKTLFRRMVSALLRAPLQWHDAVPLGRMLSRFSADFPVLDSEVSQHLHLTLEFSVGSIMALLAGIMVNPFLIIPAAALAVLYFRYARRYLLASRQVKSLENAAKGPILDHVDACLHGLSTIRAYGQIELSMEQFQKLVNRHARTFWHLWLLNRWLGFRINFMGAAFSGLSAAIIVCLQGIDASAAGFAIGFTLEISIQMALSVRGYGDVEQDMSSVERTAAYSRVPSETYKGSDIPPAWPSEGTLKIRNLVASHAPHLPPVLKGVTFNVASNERVGVVGRTGAGKSSLILALFRFLESTAGEILIDGVDISTLKIDQLRGQLAIIPQHPVIFQGTVRFNLDPFDDHADADLLAALQAVGWSMEGLDSGDDTSRVSTESALSFEADADAGTMLRCLAPEKSQSPLDKLVMDGGRNLSQGQRQLLSVARVLIQRPKILILDEATSAVDQATDKLIQRMLRDVLGRSATILAIAHRLSTIIDFDRVLVMDDGRVVEYGPPRALLEIENGMFRGMVESDPEQDLLRSAIDRS